MNILFLILGGIILLWILGTIFVIRGIEEPTYALIEKKEGYEIRAYQSYIVAEVEVSGDMHTALNNGFRQLAGYIFGGNTSQSSIKMTVPVMDTTKSSETIAMTKPVIDTLSDSGKHIIAFTMPSIYTLETLPKPNNANIRFRMVQSSRMAVLQYSWYASENRVKSKKEKLKGYLLRDGYTIKGEPLSAQYNPPLSFPPLRRNEILIEIE